MITKNAGIVESKSQVLIYGVPKHGSVPHTAVNPTNAERKKLGIKPNQEKVGDTYVETEKLYVNVPKMVTVRDSSGDAMKNDDGSYMKEPAGYNVTTLEFWFKLRHPELETAIKEQVNELKNAWWSIAIEISDKPRPVSGNTGTTQFADSFGHTTWAMDIESIDTSKYEFDKETGRPAYIGESDLLETLCVLVGLGRNSVSIDKWKELFNGNYKEINEILTTVVLDKTGTYAGYKGFKPLFAIAVSNSGKTYQDIYKKAYAYGTDANGSRIQKQIDLDASPKDKKGRPKPVFQYKGWYDKVLNGIKVYSGELDSNKGTSESKQNLFTDDDETF